MEIYSIKNDDLAQTKNWQLSGYSYENTDAGVVFAKIYEDEGDYFVQLYSDAKMNPEKLVAQGNISDVTGKVTLAEQNSSGLTGSVILEFCSETELEIIVFYACYEDLTKFERNLASLLDSENKIDGRQRFESFIEHSKRLIDSHLCTRFLRSNLTNPPLPKNIKNPQTLTEPAVFAALSALYWFLKSDFNDSNFKQALEYEKKLEKWLAMNVITFQQNGLEILLEAGSVNIRRA